MHKGLVTFNASAGSGKTFTIVKNYIAILLESKYNIRKILAITFTNKASSEMKQRVIEVLNDFSKGNDHKGMLSIISEENSISKKEIISKSKSIINHIIDNYSDFSISTIDKFTVRLIRSFSKEFGLSGDYDIEINNSEILEESVDNLLSKVGLDANISKTIFYYVNNKIRQDNSWKTIHVDLVEMASLLFDENSVSQIKKLQNLDSDVFDKIKKDIFLRNNFFEDEIRKLSKKALDLIDKNNIHHSSFSSSYVPKYFLNLQKFDKKIEKLQPTATVLKMFNKERNFYAKSSPQKQEIDEVSDILTIIFKEIEVFKSDNFDTYVLDNLILKNIVTMSILSEMHREIELLKDEKSILLLAEFNKIIQNHLLGVSSNFIYEKLGERYSHFFIDEFQDTSKMQWKNIEPLLDNAVSFGNNSILVGDPKQAIYDWRGGDVSSFINISNSDTYNSKPIENNILETNWRSQENIVHFTNEFFTESTKFIENKDYKNIYTIGNNQNNSGKKGGFANIQIIDKTEDSCHNTYDKIMDLVNNKNYDLSDICILVRGRTGGIRISEFLKERGVNVISNETLLIEKSLDILAIFDVLNIYNNERDKGFKSNLLNYLIQRNLIKIEPNKALEFAKQSIILSNNNFQESLNKNGVNINFDDFKNNSLYENISKIIRNLKIKKDSYTETILDLAFDFAIKKSNLISEFLKFWNDKKNKLSVDLSSKNSVKIMTIHKSKGLEFPVVIIPFTNWESGGKSESFWMTIDEKKYRGLSSFYIPQNKNLSQTKYSDFYKSKLDEIFFYKLNLLYVALTRAEQKLYIFVDKKPKKESQSEIPSIRTVVWNYLDNSRFVKQISDNNFALGEESSKEKKMVESDGVFMKKINYRQLSDWKNIVKISPSHQKIWSEKSFSIEKGNVIHSIMSDIKSQKDIKKAIEKSVLNGIISKEKAVVYNLEIQKIVTHNSIKEFYKEGLIIRNEQDILLDNGNTVIPDRIVIFPNKECVIIDYKTGKKSNSHIDQITSYKQALQQMQFIVRQCILVYISDDIDVVFI